MRVIIFRLTQCMWSQCTNVSDGQKDRRTYDIPYSCCCYILYLLHHVEFHQNQVIFHRDVAITISRLQPSRFGIWNLRNVKFLINYCHCRHSLIQLTKFHQIGSFLNHLEMPYDRGFQPTALTCLATVLCLSAICLSSVTYALWLNGMSYRKYVLRKK